MKTYSNIDLNINCTNYTLWNVFYVLVIWSSGIYKGHIEENFSNFVSYK